MEVMRATDEWQRAGAYYVRIQAMAKKHHIGLRQEFDDHDGDGTRYIVVLDNDFPVATARMYELPEYRERRSGALLSQSVKNGQKSLGFHVLWWRVVTIRLSSMNNLTIRSQVMSILTVIHFGVYAWKRGWESNGKG